MEASPVASRQRKRAPGSPGASRSLRGSNRSDRPLPRGLAVFRVRAFLGDWKRQRDRGSLARFGLNVEFGAVVFADSMGQRQAKAAAGGACSAGSGLGGEERLDGAAPGFLIHATAVIDDLQHDRGWSAAGMFGKGACFDGDGAPPPPAPPKKGPPHLGPGQTESQRGGWEGGGG